MDTNKSLGDLGERLAKEYLIKNGLIFVTNNYRTDHREIDLIFKDKNKIVFIEVKTRIKTIESETETPLTQRQTKNLQQAIISYCLANRIRLDNIRLDLIIILINKKKGAASLKHYKNIL